LATVDCYRLTHCPPERHSACSIAVAEDRPCWVEAAATDNRKCYACPVYRLASFCICGPKEMEHAQAWPWKHSG
jgi:hypothetical protein